MLHKTSIGIDLGTTHTLAARAQKDGSVEFFDWGSGVLLPSLVGITPQGQLVFGDQARQFFYHHGFKREMGYPHQYPLGSTQLTASELSALLLQYIKPQIESAWGSDDEITISVPTYFSDRARRATLAACQLADLPVSRLINEPTAIAVALGFSRPDQLGQTLILDLGGGTFDVSLLEYSDGLLEVLATAGDCFLGGMDLTEILLEELLQFPDSPLRGLSEKQQFAWAETLKKELSSSSKITLAGHSYYAIQLEVAAQPLWKKFRFYIDRVLTDSRLSCYQISQVILAGGGTHTPFFQHWIEDYFPQAKIHRQNPETLVAQGTALFGTLHSDQGELSKLFITEVNPYSIGVKINRRVGYRTRESYATLIPRNSPLPTKVEQTFLTASPGQTSIRLEIYQGESRLLKKNELIGYLHLTELPESNHQQEIKVTFRYSTQATLEVCAHIISTGEKIAARFDRNDGLADLLSLKDSQKRLHQFVSNL